MKRDPKFRRDGVDVFTEEEISYYDAILGEQDETWDFVFDRDYLFLIL